jgi:hypothetical protein
MWRDPRAAASKSAEPLPILCPCHQSPPRHIAPPSHRMCANFVAKNAEKADDASA